MKTIPVPGFTGPTYQAVSNVMNCERSVNLYPETGAEHSKAPASLVGRPGLSASPFMTVPDSPVRDLFAGDSRLFVVAGRSVFEVGSAGTVITDYLTMAGSSGVGPAAMRANGTQLLVLDRSASMIFNANPVGPSMDPVFAAIALEYLDGFYIAIASGGLPNQINVSNYLDGTTWDPLDVVQRTGGSDTCNQLAVLNGQLWIFGQATTEIWYNAGTPRFPFQRMPGATLNYGCLAPGSVVVFENTIMWLGTDANGFAHVYMTRGQQVVQVSTPAIENQLGMVSASNPAGDTFGLVYSYAFSYTESGHTFYVLLRSSNSFIPTDAFVYDLSTGQWHERDYAGPWPVCYASVPGSSFAIAGPSIVGDGFSGNLYYQGLGYPSDGGTAITYTRTFPHIADRNHAIKYPLLELDAQLGTAQVGLSWSNDGGTTFPFTRSAISGSGETSQGQAPRFRWWQLGTARDRVFRMTITNSTELVRLVNCYVGVGASEQP